MKRGLFFIALFSICIFTGCSTYSDEELSKFDSRIKHYIDSTGIAMQPMGGGLYYHIIKEGNGKRKIQFNDEVTFYYTGSYLNGTIFQKIKKEKSITYKVNELIAGWQNALMLLKEGGHIKIIIPPQLAYGDNKTKLIPPNTILKYDLYVTKVR